MLTRVIQCYPELKNTNQEYINVNFAVIGQGVKRGKLSCSATGLFLTLKEYCNDSNPFELYETSDNIASEIEECVKELEGIGLIKVFICKEGEENIQIVHLYNPKEILL